MCKTVQQGINSQLLRDTFYVAGYLRLQILIKLLFDIKRWNYYPL